jgi:hypothetical protein
MQPSSARAESPTPRLNVPEHEPAAPERRACERESFWQPWRLTAAVASWVFLLIAVAADRLSLLPPDAVVVLYAAAYLSGGTFATIKAVRQIAHRLDRIASPLPIGTVGQEGSSVIVVLNGLRLLSSGRVTSSAAGSSPGPGLALRPVSSDGN